MHAPSNLKNFNILSRVFYFLQFANSIFRTLLALGKSRQRAEIAHSKTKTYEYICSHIRMPFSGIGT